jgi:hypothetical protein
MTQNKHLSYEERFQRRRDFVVSYQLQLDPRLDGRQSLRQGQRTDFCYAEDYTESSDLNIYMIYPEFLDQDGSVIRGTAEKIPDFGFAYMWILDEKLRSFHRERLNIGTAGFMVVGSFRIARLVVTNIDGMNDRT